MPETFEHLPILAELRADLDAAFRSAPAAPPRRARMRVRARRGWLVPGAGLATAVGVAAALALTSGLDSGHVSPPPATAAEALRRVAAVAEHAAAPVPRDDQYYYVRSQGSDVSMFAGVGGASYATHLVTQERQIWTSIDRVGRLEARLVDSRPLTPADAQKNPPPVGKRELQPAGHDPTTIDAEGHYLLGNERLTRAQLLAFPTDPAWIYHQLRAGVGTAGHSPDGEVFTVIGDALREAPAPSGLRAALYRTLALVPGVELTGAVHDRLGRAGLAVAFTEVGLRHELIFDPATSEMLAERQLIVDPKVAQIDAPPGTVIEDQVYLQRAVTDDLKPPPR